MIPLYPYLIGVNLLAYLMYWQDKRAARSGGWRVSEFMLLMVGFVGGTVGAFVAQRVLRHKNRKASFQWKFWLTTAAQIGLLLFPPMLLRQLLAHLFR